MNQRPTTAEPTALEAYQARRADIAVLLDWLGQELDRADEEAKAEPTSFCHEGSMAHVRHLLIDVVECISGIEREQIEQALRE